MSLTTQNEVLSESGQAGAFVSAKGVNFPIVGDWGRTEIGENSLNSFHEAVERWHDGRPWKGIGIAEHYVDGDLEIVVELHAHRLVNGHPDRLYAHFSCVNFDFADRQSAASTLLTGIDVLNGAGPRHCNEKLMLILNVEDVKVSQRHVASVVRLGVNEPLLKGGRETFYCWNATGPRMSEVVGLSEDMKPSLPSLARFDQVVEHEVKRCARIVDGIANDGTPGVRNETIHFDARALMAGVKVLMQQNLVWLTLPKVVDFGYEIVDVGVGPLKFDAGTGEYVWHE